MSPEDVTSLETLEKETKYLDGRYQVPMLWKDPPRQLSNNFPVAWKRWLLLEKKLRRDSKLFEGCKKVIQGYLTEDPPVARKMSKEEAAVTHMRTNYLPMHPVTNPNKPGKIRLVNPISTGGVT